MQASIGKNPHMVEGCFEKKVYSKPKIHLPVAFGSKMSSAQFGIPTSLKAFSPFYIKFLDFLLFLWETTKPTLLLTDKHLCTRFFQTKLISLSLWNECVRVRQFDSKTAHNDRLNHTATDFLSRLKLQITEKIKPKIKEKIHTTPIETTTSSSRVIDEEQFFFTQADNKDGTGK